MLTLTVHLHAAFLRLVGRLEDRPVRRRDERGQASAEYALVVLGAAFVAFLFVTWAQKSGKIGKLLDTVLDEVTDLV